MIGYRHDVCLGVLWRENQRGLFPLSPPHLLTAVSEKDARGLLSNENELFARWESHFDLSDGMSWWHIIKDGSVELSNLSSNTRSKVRRGLKSFDCEPISKETVLDEGYEVYGSAYSRYETHEKKFSREEFAQAVHSLPEQTEFWGVRDKSTKALVAFSENYVEAEVSFYNTIWFEPSALRRYSSYVLFYEMNRHYIEERKFRYVSDGARSLSHETQIHDFLESKFGFRKAYARLHVVYTPWLSAAIAVAFPLRKLINKVSLGPFKKASIILKQEKIRRECVRGGE